MGESHVALFFLGVLFVGVSNAGPGKENGKSEQDEQTEESLHAAFSIG
jgi:hypothetical protein